MEFPSTRKRSALSREKFVSRVISPAIRKQPCPICLQVLEERRAAVITGCFHAYCLNCIRRWSNLKRNCPLCNSEFRSWYFRINISSQSFQEERLPTLEEVKSVVPRFGIRYRDRLRTMRSLSDELTRGNQRTRPLPQRRTFGRPFSHPIEVIEERKLQWRASIYNRHLQAVPISSQNSPIQNILANSGMKEILLRRIEPWVQRELHAILQDPDNSIIVHVVTSLFTASLERNSIAPSGQLGSENNFLAPLQRFLHDKTDMFWHELRCFAESSLNMGTYDTVVEYRLTE